MRLSPIPAPSVQYLTCTCGRVLHVTDGAALCEVCQVRHSVTVETTPLPAEVQAL